MAKMHKWRRHPDGKVAHQVCIVCGATRWGIPGGWGRAMLDGKPTKYCKGGNN